MGLLKLLLVLGHAPATPTAPGALGQWVARPVVRKVGFNVGVWTYVALELVDYGGAVLRISKKAVISEADAVCPVWTGRLGAVMVGEGEAKG